MGAVFCTKIVYKAEATTYKELQAKFSEIVRDYKYEYGHGGYTGTLAEKDDLEVSNKKFTTCGAASEHICEIADKWGAAIAVTVEEEGKEPYWLIGAWCSE